MQELDDNALLREYVEHDSEEAFAALVERHVNKVYSVALRHTRNPGDAEEITQVVFIILAQKSGKLGRKVILSGWLYQAARLTATTFIRSEIRRARREQEAGMQSMLNEASPDIWGELSPLIDGAMGKLERQDRDALVLRFFDGKSMQEVGAVLGASEDAAKMRVSRALEKIRKILAKGGFDCTTSILAEQLSDNSICVAPAALAESATALALTKGAAASTSTLTLTKGALKLMAWTKTKIAVTAAAILALFGTGMAGYKAIQAHRRMDVYVSSWEIGSDGIIRFRERAEGLNDFGKPLPAGFQISLFDPGDVEQLTDETGQDLKYTKLSGSTSYGEGLTNFGEGLTNQNQYNWALNHPVPLGGKFIWIERGKLDGRKVTYHGQPFIQPTGAPGEFQFIDHEEYGFLETLDLKSTWRLPPGAVLLEKEPADLVVVTNQGQVEVHFDALLPVPNIGDYRLRYRLASAAQ